MKCRSRMRYFNTSRSFHNLRNWCCLELGSWRGGGTSCRVQIIAKHRPVEVSGFRRASQGDWQHFDVDYCEPLWHACR